MNSEHKCRLSVDVDENFSMFLTENYGVAEENLKTNTSRETDFNLKMLPWQLTEISTKLAKT